MQAFPLPRSAESARIEHYPRGANPLSVDVGDVGIRSTETTGLPVLPTLSERIKWCRKQRENADGRRWPVADICEVVGIHTYQYYRWTKKVRALDVEKARPLAAFFGVRTLWLQRGDPDLPLETTLPDLQTVRERLEWAKLMKERRDDRVYSWPEIFGRGQKWDPYKEILSRKSSRIRHETAVLIAQLLAVCPLWLQKGIVDRHVPDTEPDLPKLSDRLKWALHMKEKRDGRAYTWADVLRTTGITRPTLQPWLRDETRITAPCAKRVASHFGVDALWLQRGSISETSNGHVAAIEDHRDRLQWAKAQFERRSGAAYSWSDISHLSGVSLPGISQCTTGSRRLSATKAEKLGRVFGVCPRWLRTGESQTWLDSGGVAFQNKGDST